MVNLDDWWRENSDAQPVKQVYQVTSCVGLSGRLEMPIFGTSKSQGTQIIQSATLVRSRWQEA